MYLDPTNFEIKDDILYGNVSDSILKPISSIYTPNNKDELKPIILRYIYLVSLFEKSNINITDINNKFNNFSNKIKNNSQNYIIIWTVYSGIPIIFYVYNNDIFILYFKDTKNMIDISKWDVTNVNNMSELFYWENKSMSNVLNDNAHLININTWDVSNVENMDSMFKGVTSFNQDIRGWKVDKVKYMSSMFENATSFNQDIRSWNVDNVLVMSRMFKGATSFNQNIGGWNVGKVIDMSHMFEGATSFNQNIGGWNVGNVEYMDSMFKGATSFNQDLNQWQKYIKNTTDIKDIFHGATSLNENNKIKPPNQNQNQTKKTQTKKKGQSKGTQKNVKKKSSEVESSSKKESSEAESLSKKESSDIESSSKKESSEAESLSKKESSDEPDENTGQVNTSDINEEPHPNEEDTITFNYDTFYKYYVNPKNYTTIDNPRQIYTSYYADNILVDKHVKSVWKPSENDKYIQLSFYNNKYINNNPGFKRFYIKFIVGNINKDDNKKHILFSFLKTANGYKYDDHYHFNIYKDTVDFHKTIQKIPESEDEVPSKTNETCNFNNHTIFHGFDGFKKCACKNTLNLTMGSSFSEEDLYYIYQIISRPFLDNQKVQNNQKAGNVRSKKKCRRMSKTIKMRRH